MYKLFNSQKRLKTWFCLKLQIIFSERSCLINKNHKTLTNTAMEQQIAVEREEYSIEVNKSPQYIAALIGKFEKI